MKYPTTALFAALAIVLSASADRPVSEIKVDLRFDYPDYVSGERIRAVVDIANSSPGTIAVAPGSNDVFFIEVSRASDAERLPRKSGARFIADFTLKSGEGQKFETFLGDRYDLSKPRRYLAKPVLVHNGTRYEGDVRAFDVVDGLRIDGAMQMFSGKSSLQRNFTLLYWPRKGAEHLFLAAKDSGSSKRVFETRDLGIISRMDRPIIGILPGGEVVVIHRLNTDQYIRTEFWSFPDELLFRERGTVTDPEIAGTARVRELYRDNGIKPKKNPWWKFW